MRKPPQFPYKYAKYLKENFPEIWRAGGNIRGNDSFRWWTQYRQGKRTPQVVYWWETTRPAWIARHFNDHRLPGVIAQIKWGTVGKLGVVGMKRVVEDAIPAEQAAIPVQQAAATFTAAPEQQVVAAAVAAPAAGGEA